MSSLPAKTSALILILALWVPQAFAAGSLDQTIDQLEHDWAVIYYDEALKNKEEGFKSLLHRVRQLRSQHPDEAQVLIWEAILLCTYAGEKSNLSSLFMVKDARDLLLKAIEINPDAMNASAYVTLGNLYYRVPGWPISFGDDEKARIYLEKALSLDPDAIDTNYFYGDFLLHQGEQDKAVAYLTKALRIPSRPHQIMADQKLKKDVRQTLQKALDDSSSWSGLFDPIGTAEAAPER